MPDPRDATVDRYFWGHSYGRSTLGRRNCWRALHLSELPVADGVTLYSFSTLSYRRSRKNTGSFLPNNAVRPNDNTALPEVYPLGFNALPPHLRDRRPGRG